MQRSPRFASLDGCSAASFAVFVVLREVVVTKVDLVRHYQYELFVEVLSAA
jgi:hypothetical protein